MDAVWEHAGYVQDFVISPGGYVFVRERIVDVDGWKSTIEFLFGPKGNGPLAPVLADLKIDDVSGLPDDGLFLNAGTVSFLYRRFPAGPNGKPNELAVQRLDLVE